MIRLFFNVKCLMSLASYTEESPTVTGFKTRKLGGGDDKEGRDKLSCPDMFCQWFSFLNRSSVNMIHYDRQKPDRNCVNWIVYVPYCEVSSYVLIDVLTVTRSVLMLSISLSSLVVTVCR